MTAAAQLPALSEDLFQGQVIDLARAHRWRVAHFRPAKTARGWRTPVQADGAGFPDLVLVRGPELLVVELKAARGRVSPAQREWLDMLAAAGVETHVWRPSDFDELAARLRRPHDRAAGAFPPPARPVTTPAVRRLADELRLGQRFRHPGAGVAATVHQIHRRDRSVTLLIPAVRREVPFTDLAGQWERAS